MMGLKPKQREIVSRFMIETVEEGVKKIFKAEKYQRSYDFTFRKRNKFISNHTKFH